MKAATSFKAPNFQATVLPLLLIFALLLSIPVSAIAYTTHSGTINSETWGPGTHFVTGSVTVADNEVLTIQPGAVVKFAPSTQLTVNGTLRAQATGAGDSIVFTSRDDNSFGETVAGSDGVPARGDWYGIYLDGSGDYEGIGEFDHCLFRYGGYSGSATIDANVHFSGSDSGRMVDCVSENSGYHGVRITNCSPLITDSTFSNNGYHGLEASGSGTPTITDNTFTNNSQYAAHVNLTAISPLISGNTGSGNKTNGLVFQGTVNADQTWTSMPNFPIVLWSSVIVSDNVRLTISAGTVVKFNTNTQLTVNGTLDANGADASRVVFTSLKDDTYDGDTNGDGNTTAPARGDWYGIYLDGSGNNEGIGEFDHCLFRYGGYSGSATIDANVHFSGSDSGRMVDCVSENSGYHGVRITNCSPLITDSTFSNNGYHGLEASGSGTPTITDNTFTNNSQYAAHVNLTAISPLISGNTGSGNKTNGLVFQGTVNADQTWTSMPNFPIVLWSSVIVSDNVRLTISAGTVVKFNTNTQLTVNGTLDANGADASRVVFTSLKDDTYDGDTNGDGNTTAPARGDWYGIYLDGSGNNEGIGEFDHCLFRYGGYSGSATIDANVHFSGSDSGRMVDCVSENSGYHGVRITNCSPLITDSTFSNNGYHGLEASGSGTPTITDNTFTNNSQYAAHVNLTAISPLISGNTGSGNKTNGLVFQGTVNADQTWTSMPNFPIVLWSSVIVSDNVRLTISAGTVVKFNTNTQLTVNGTLDANGADASRVVFTSLKDDTYDGDTNGDGNATAPARGNWYGIYLDGSADNEGIGEFDHCLFRYGGYSGSATIDANVHFSGSDSGRMVDCVSENSGYHGVRITNCSPLIANSTISNNTQFGLFLTSAAPRIINSIIWGNTSGGISGGTPTVFYSDIQGGFTGEGNINLDPQFLDPAISDYRLDTCSPAVDAGDPVEFLAADYVAGGQVLTVDRVTAVTPGSAVWITDGANLDESVVVSTTPTTITVSTGFAHSYTVGKRSYIFTSTSDFYGEPDPNGWRINMGAYGGTGEAAPTLTCRCDLGGGDQDVDGSDLHAFRTAMGAYNPAADFNHDGVVNAIDLAFFAEEFGRTDCEVCP